MIDSDHAVCDLAVLYTNTEKSHGPYLNVWEGRGRLAGEVHELDVAMHERDGQRIYEEALDVANVALRLAARARMELEG